jgi:hypothetical protein
MLVHLAGVVVVGGCLALGYWQYLRAAGGNTLSWAYVFEWPIFAGFAAYLWWDLVHHPHRERPVEAPPQVLPPGWTNAAALGARSAYADPPGAALGHGAERAGEVVPAAPGIEVFSPDAPASLDPKERQELERLAAYNRYLAELSANGRPKKW